MNKFKIGDKVYHPAKTTEVLTIRRNSYSSYPIRTNDESFTLDGRRLKSDVLPSIFHATPEMWAKLEALFEAEFEKPHVKPTSREIIAAMLDIEKLPVPCWVSNVSEQPSSVNNWIFIDEVVDDNYPFIDKNERHWKYATPFDRTTLQPITELPE